MVFCWSDVAVRCCCLCLVFLWCCYWCLGVLFCCIWFMVVVDLFVLIVLIAVLFWFDLGVYYYMFCDDCCKLVFSCILLFC